LSLERAKAAPLTIYLSMSGDTGFLDLLLPHHQNIRSLSFAKPVPVEKLTRALPNFFKSMPSLRSLTLEAGSWSQHIDPLDFSAAHALKELSLHSIPLYPSILNLRTLTKFSLVDYYFNLHLDILLGFLEQNHSLQSATLCIGFMQPPLRRSQRQTPIENRLLHLSISCDETADGRALISNIALRSGAALKINYRHPEVTLTAMLSGVSMAHLRNLSSPTFMEYQTFPRVIRLAGPDGSFSYSGTYSSEGTFREFPLLPLDSIRDIHLKYRKSWVPTELHLSSFPSLEVLVIDGTDSRIPLSTVLPDSASSSLKTLAFLNCAITEDFMGELVRFASRREKRIPALLHRVVIIDSSDERLPSVASIARLRKYVPVVEVMDGRELPKDVSWRGSGSLTG